MSTGLNILDLLYQQSLYRYSKTWARDGRLCSVGILRQSSAAKRCRGDKTLLNVRAELRIIEARGRVKTVCKHSFLRLRDGLCVISAKSCRVGRSRSELTEADNGERGSSPKAGTVSVRRTLAAVLAAVLAGVLAVSCSEAGASGDKELKLAIQPWDENVAVSTLTKVLLEEDLGYDNVELQVVKLPVAFEEVSDGELDAFQDVWIPNHQKLLDKASDGVEYLDPWFEGETNYGIAVPYYMNNVKSIADLDSRAGTDLIIGIEPDVPFHRQIKNKVIPEYNLDMKLVASSTPAMLSELKRAYEAREPIVFLGWSPHWMNVEYRFYYLDDPKDAQGKFNDSSEISTIVRKDLKKDDPVAYELIKSISLLEGQVNALESEINEAGDPVKGTKNWLKYNREVVDPWVEAAETAQES